MSYFDPHATLLLLLLHPRERLMPVYGSHSRAGLHYKLLTVLATR